MFLVRAVHLVRQLHRRRRNIHEVELGAQGLHHASILVQIPCEDGFPQCRPAEFQAARRQLRYGGERRELDLPFDGALNLAQLAILARLGQRDGHPPRPARPVRPIRWTYLSGAQGTSKLMT